jgi:hypothetical protein
VGDMGDMYRDWKEHKKAHRRELGVPCPTCPPNRCATILMPGQRCRVCGYRDERTEAK